MNIEDPKTIDEAIDRASKEGVAPIAAAIDRFTDELAKWRELLAKVLSVGKK